MTRSHSKQTTRQRPLTVWLLCDPHDVRFARAGRRGTWTPAEGLCPECSASSSRRVMPLVIEWLPGADGEGIHPRLAELVGVGLFRIKEFPEAVFCTETVKAMLKQHGFSNVDHLEWGEIG